MCACDRLPSPLPSPLAGIAHIRIFDQASPRWEVPSSIFAPNSLLAGEQRAVGAGHPSGACCCPSCAPQGTAPSVVLPSALCPAVRGLDRHPRCPRPSSAYDSCRPARPVAQAAPTPLLAGRQLSWCRWSPHPLAWACCARVPRRAPRLTAAASVWCSRTSISSGPPRWTRRDTCTAPESVRRRRPTSQCVAGGWGVGWVGGAGDQAARLAPVCFRASSQVGF